MFQQLELQQPGIMNTMGYQRAKVLFILFKSNDGAFKRRNSLLSITCFHDHAKLDLK